MHGNPSNGTTAFHTTNSKQKSLKQTYSVLRTGRDKNAPRRI